MNYVYDGDGKRIEKSSGTVYWYASASLSAGGAGTEILDESNSSGTITNEYVFFGGKRVAMRACALQTDEGYVCLRGMGARAKQTRVLTY
ncbi:MAG TPA: hypothetical protein VGR81_12065 [Candidatus Acidoferrales bacterium]|nr:hypothetical protein [Candidatus Acidoferrales bacterium]